MPHISKNSSSGGSGSAFFANESNHYFSFAFNCIGKRIDGKINGNLKVHGEEDSLLIMGHGSKITGDVEVEKAIINGEINGNIKCHDYLELNTNAIVNGSIEYDIIEVHEGSKITGNLKYSKNSQITRQ